MAASITDADDLVELLERVKRAPGLFRVETYNELAVLLHGIDLGTGLLPAYLMTEWLLSDGDPRWGRRGGPGWIDRVAADAIPDFYDPEVGWRAGFTEEQEAVIRGAVICKAVEWLRRPNPG